MFLNCKSAHAAYPAKNAYILLMPKMKSEFCNVLHHLLHGVTSASSLYHSSPHSTYHTHPSFSHPIVHPDHAAQTAISSSCYSLFLKWLCDSYTALLSSFPSPTFFTQLTPVFPLGDTAPSENP